MKSRNVLCRIAKEAWLALDCCYPTLKAVQHHGNVHETMAVERSCLRIACVTDMQQCLIDVRYKDDMCNFF